MVSADGAITDRHKTEVSQKKSVRHLSPRLTPKKKKKKRAHIVTLLFYSTRSLHFMDSSLHGDAPPDPRLGIELDLSAAKGTPYVSGRIVTEEVQYIIQTGYVCHVVQCMDVCGEEHHFQLSLTPCMMGSNCDS